MPQRERQDRQRPLQQVKHKARPARESLSLEELALLWRALAADGAAPPTTEARSIARRIGNRAMGHTSPAHLRTILRRC